MYFARYLWDWYQQKPTDPLNRQLCWREDWHALHDKYDPNGYIPDSIKLLPMLDRNAQLTQEKGEVME